MRKFLLVLLFVGILVGDASKASGQQSDPCKPGEILVPPAMACGVIHNPATSQPGDLSNPPTAPGEMLTPPASAQSAAEVGALDHWRGVLIAFLFGL